MKDAFGPEKSRDLIVQSLTELSKENNFVYRVAACQALAKCANALDKKDLSDLFTDFGKICVNCSSETRQRQGPKCPYKLSKVLHDTQEHTERSRQKIVDSNCQETQVKQG